MWFFKKADKKSATDAAEERQRKSIERLSAALSRARAGEVDSLVHALIPQKDKASD